MSAIPIPHPEQDIARRIAELEARGFPDVMVWTPLVSASGKWEAMGNGWRIEEERPSVFCDKLQERLTATEGQ